MSDSCVNVYLDMKLDSSMGSSKDVIKALMDRGLVIDGVNKNISNVPCSSGIDLYSCPPVRPETPESCGQLIVQYCQEMTMPCGEDEKCCEDACGSSHCVEVGFLQKVHANITVEMEYMSEFGDKSSPVFIAAKSGLEEGINNMMKLASVTGYKSTKVLGFKPAINGMMRKKRQTQITVILLEMKFTEDLPVEELMGIKSALLKDGFMYNGLSWVVRSIDIGEEGACDDECSQGSICVTRIGGMQQCACPKHRTGRYCELGSCIVDGQSICQNGGTCGFSENSSDMGCMCPDGYMGELCEVNPCDYVKETACNTGRCLSAYEDWMICMCPLGTGGLFCEKETGDETMSACERHRRVMEYSLSVLNGSVPDDKMTVPISEYFALLGETSILLPECWPHEEPHMGGYYSYCEYSLDNGEKTDKCWCTNTEGMYNAYYYDKETGMCQAFSGKICDGSPCSNGGTCHDLDNGGFECECTQNFTGQYCERSVDQKCDLGEPLMTSDGQLRQCRTASCPVGFSCNAHPADRWTACCVKWNFMCDLDPCQAGGICVGDIYSGNLCQCPTGRTGLFCEKTSQENTECQKKEAFYTFAENFLKTGRSELNISLDDFRMILYHIGYEYLLKDMCDAQGNYRRMATAFNIRSPNSDGVSICLDEFGSYDPKCTDAVCEALKYDGQSLCKNGAKCHGDVTYELCSCAGTGHHGVLCDKPGEVWNYTDCTQRRDIGMMAIGILDGSVDMAPGNDALQNVIHNILSVLNTNTVWIPTCDRDGHFMDSGCEYDKANPSQKLCYCADMDGNRYGSEESPIRAPENCRGDHGGESPKVCPEEWGPQCMKPEWWCDDNMKCVRGKERCVNTCQDVQCLRHEMKCVPKDQKTACDPRPCKDDPYSRCNPCGMHGTCITNAMQAWEDSMDSDMDDEGEGMQGGQGGRAGPINIASTINRPNPSDMSMDIDMDMDNDMYFMCECQDGFSGKRCEINTDVCNTVPTGFCKTECIGDIDAGILCRCEEGYSGILCNKIALSECERKKALYDDAIAILKGEMSIPGYTPDQLASFVMSATRALGGDAVPLLTCTESGMYEKVQCQVNIVNTDEIFCHCVDANGMYKDSNIKPYIGYPLCTAPTDFRISAQQICSLDMVYAQMGMEMKVCLNEGTCVYNPMEGKMCECPDGYHGQFCQTEGAKQDEPKSLCEFMAAAWDTVHTIKTDATIQMSEMQSLLMLNLTIPMISPNEDMTSGLKYQCYDDGRFKPVACYHNFLTGEIGTCHCLGEMGPVMDKVVDGPDSMDCDMSMQCPPLRCEMNCEFGYRKEMLCPTCQCKKPCEDVKCKEGERCVIEREFCPDGFCAKPHCAPITKPGVCPVHEATAVFSSITGGSLSPSMASSAVSVAPCPVTCRDDADCDGKQKCCGICGSQCVEAEAMGGCEDELRRFEAKRQQLLNAARTLMETQNRTEEMEKILSKVTAMEMDTIWVPSCFEDKYLYKPLQCMYTLATAGSPTAVPEKCFCVDRLGNRIKGAVANASDPDSCTEKPGTCPVSEPSPDDVSCETDMDCVGGAKCCNNGVDDVCAKPANDSMSMMTVVDRLMMNLCELDQDLCQGRCVNTWMMDGIACECPEGRYGPFCEMTIENEEDVPKSACERKKLALSIFLGQLAAAETDPVGIAVAYRHYIEKEILEDLSFDYQEEGISVVRYTCTPYSSYAPTQCIVDLLHKDKPAQCFCVDENGKELPGTRMKDGQPFCGDNGKYCQVGEPSRDANGNLRECGTCPEGYACKRSTYGKLYCCPTEEEKDNKCPYGAPGPVCSKNRLCPKGYACHTEGNSISAAGVCCESTPDTDICSSMDDQDIQCYRYTERFFYNKTAGMCQQFKACSVGRNNFRTMEDCCQTCNMKGRCKSGTCPAVRPGLVATCRDECTADRECPGPTICCSNGCGHACMLPEVKRVSDCMDRQIEARRMIAASQSNRNTCNIINVPKCERDGSWAMQQCQAALGVCWCVTPYGHYIAGTVKKGVAQCNQVSSAMIMRAEEARLDFADVEYNVCPNGEFHCCSEALCQKKCQAYPNAECRIDPCGGCKAKYYNSIGLEINNCDQGLSKCETELKEVAIAIKSRQLTERMAAGIDLNMDDMDVDDDDEEEEDALVGNRVFRYDIPTMCQLPPRAGVCKGFLKQWYYDPVHDTCDMFVWGMCDGNANRFSSPEDCFNSCYESKNPCNNTVCPGDKPMCKLQYDENCYTSDTPCELTPVCTEMETANLARDVYVPQCESDGNYNYKQCHGSYCWCVDINGQYVNGLTLDDLECTANGHNGQTLLRVEACLGEGGRQPNPECAKACASAVCPGKPKARCEADLCSDTCKAKFVDENGEEVTCGDDVCQVFSFEETSQCAAPATCDSNAKVRNCPASVCQKALSQNCSRNPCAICQVDPCSCKPYFVDANDPSRRLSEAECQYLSLGTCDLKKCSVKAEVERAKFSGVAIEEAALPECDSQGSFKSEQCNGDKCECVDAFGAPITKEAGSSCKPQDKVKKVKVSLKLNGDFKKLQREGKLNDIKDQVLNKLISIGIDPKTIKSISDPYEGSIKVDIEFEATSDSATQDLALVTNAVEQSIATGAFDLDVDGETLPVDNDGTIIQPQTASQVAEEEEEKKKKEEEEKKKAEGEDSGLTETEKIIIGVVCGAVGLLIIVVIAYCVCCKQRKSQPQENEYDHIRENSTKSPAVYNQAYEDDSRYLKMRL